MVGLRLPCVTWLLIVLWPIVTARVCVIGNEPDREGRMRWITAGANDPCDCSMSLPGGLNTSPVLQRSLPVAETDNPIVTSVSEEIQRHYHCGERVTPSPPSTMIPQTITEESSHSTTPLSDSMTSPSSPPNGWIQLVHYDRSDQDKVTMNTDVLERWDDYKITAVTISMRGNMFSSSLELKFDGVGSDNVSWFTHRRLQESPWGDLDESAVFNLNWMATTKEILGIHSEVRGDLPVDGWMRWALPGIEESSKWGTDVPPTIAFGREGKVHWRDRDLLSRDKPAQQSSTPYPSISLYGIDYDSKSRTSTGYELEPWWMVVLEDVRAIDEVTVTACAQGKGKTEVTGVQVRVSDTSDIDSGVLCGIPIRDQAAPDTSITILCSQSPRGRFVSLRVDGDYGAIGFCGIRALSKGPAELDLEAAWQSSVLVRNASLSVDGKIGRHEADLTCSQTRKHDQDSPWWQVDLGDTLIVEMVVISPFPSLPEWLDMAGASVVISNSKSPFDASGSAEGCGGPLSLDDLSKHRPLLVKCTPTLHGRYVFLVGIGRPLSMCEVEVFGKVNGGISRADVISIHAKSSII